MGEEDDALMAPATLIAGLLNEVCWVGGSNLIASVLFKALIPLPPPPHPHPATHPAFPTLPHHPSPPQVMCPFTPFLTEAMYQNLSKCLPADQAPPSVHFCDFPAQQDALPGDEVRGGAC